MSLVRYVSDTFSSRMQTEMPSMNHLKWNQWKILKFSAVSSGTNLGRAQLQ